MSQITLVDSKAKRYEAGKARALLHRRETSAQVRDIGKPPRIATPSRRRRTLDSLSHFLTTYFPNAFYLGFSADHLDVISALERIATHGGLYAIAMPRGSGKTTIVVRAALWAILTQRRRFVSVVSSTDAAAKAIVRSLKTELTWNKQLYKDFPRELHGIPQLQGDNRSAGGQLCGGEKTEIKMGVTELVFPTIYRSGTSGAIISAVGLTGNIRGQFYTQKDGTVIRPDFAILDDPQTKESARSLAQTKERMEIIEGDVLGMSGPDREMAAVMPCTVIEEDDLADRALKMPQWNGKRTKALYVFPKNMDWWERYFSTRQHDGTSEATALYEDERSTADEGAVVAWEGMRKPADLSALQSVMHLWYRSPSAFAAEYQNEPQAKTTVDKELLTAAAIREKLNGIDRGIVPAELGTLCCYIDVQQDVFFWLVSAWGAGFAGAIVDYGVFPEQNRDYFSLVDVRNRLREKYPGRALEGWIYAGLADLTAKLLTREFPRFGGGGVRIQRCLIDAMWGPSTDVVYQFCRQSPHSALLLPSHGRGITAGNRPMTSWQVKPPGKIGHDWVLSRGDGARGIVHVTIDTNAWKTFTQTRLSTPIGDKGSLTLFGNNSESQKTASADVHRMLSEHLTAEYRTKTTGHGRDVDEWRQKPDSPDNHWLDCLVGSAVAASIQGVTMDEWGPLTRPRVTGQSATRVNLRSHDGRSFFATDR